MGVILVSSSIPSSFRGAAHPAEYRQCCPQEHRRYFCSRGSSKFQGRISTTVSLLIRAGVQSG